MTKPLFRRTLLAGSHLSLDLGHDTDSTAQRLGAFIGAIHGPNILPQNKAPNYV